MKRIAVLASGSGSNLQALLDAAQRGELPARIVVVITDRFLCGADRRAAQRGIATVCLPVRRRRDHDERMAHDAQLAAVLAAFDPDLVVLAGWMLILGPAVLGRFPGRIVNVHPALLPDGDEALVASSHGPLPALRGHQTVREALALDMPLTGATVHYVTETVDAGPVILREEVPIFPGDDEAGLHERIKTVEHRLLPQAVAMALAAQ
ncbi:MAG: phosphoribosylglycinamide formyltransferase [Thermomicrobiales bacterium]